ncbi:hypothetical protein ACET3Z_001688 [Daucus carota]
METALNHVKSAGLLGDGFDSTTEMCTRNLIWVATKMQVMVNRYPTWGDVVQIDTWVAPSGKNGMRRDWLLRDYYTENTYSCFRWIGFLSNKSEIYFLKRTNMTLIEEEDDMIPKYKFELVSLNALKLKVGNTKILTDLIGLVVNVLPMQSRNTPTGPKDILLIDITDGSEKIRSIANNYKQTHCHRQNSISIQIMMQCTVLNNANEPIIVDDIPSATHFTVKKIDTYNLKQISDLRSSDLQNLEVICHVLVCSIDAQSRWWFYSCDSCPEELSFVDDTYKCECGKIVSYPDKRFKVPMYVTYPTETIQVFMFDREIRRLVSTTVNNLIGQNLKVPTSHLEGCAVHDTPEIKSPSNKRTLKKDDGSNKITIVLSHTFRLCDLFFQDYVLVLIWFLV